MFSPNLRLSSDLIRNIFNSAFKMWNIGVRPGFISKHPCVCKSSICTDLRRVARRWSNDATGGPFRTLTLARTLPTSRQRQLSLWVSRLQASIPSISTAKSRSLVERIHTAAKSMAQRELWDPVAAWCSRLGRTHSCSR